MIYKIMPRKNRIKLTKINQWKWLKYEKKYKNTNESYFFVVKITIIIKAERGTKDTKYPGQTTKKGFSL